MSLYGRGRVNIDVWFWTYIYMDNVKFGCHVCSVKEITFQASDEDYGG